MTLHNGIRKERVQAHARCHGERQPGEESHGDGGQAADQAGRESGCGRRDPGIGQNRRIDRDDVAHRKEGGRSRDDFCPDTGSTLPDLEIAIQRIQHADLRQR